MIILATSAFVGGLFALAKGISHHDGADMLAGALMIVVGILAL